MGLLDELRTARRLAGQRTRTAVPETAAQPALLFIPDISGFTRFIEESGNNQAPWLIADLLEILIEANVLNMQVNEIQGDAILFYRLGPPPTIAELASQCRRVFLDFQNYLRIIERDTDSALAAVVREHALTLKIIVHYGPVHVARIREHTKLMGRDVIVVHRLLKNDVVGSEYVLLSAEYLATQRAAAIRAAFPWTRLLAGVTNYQYLGDIHYQYAHLTPLRLLLQGAEPGRSNAVQVRRVLPVSAAYALRVVSNLRLRPNWLQGTHSVRYDVSKSNRLGSTYNVGLNRGQVDFQAVQHFVGAERLEYVEKIAHFRMFPNSLLFFFLEEISDKACLLTLEFRYGHVAATSRLVRFGQLRRLHRFLGASVHALAALCRQLTRPGPGPTPPNRTKPRI
ncbi:DUF2652 domain-containing protein [Hymenobacter lutimineralis]|uniref:DUF2652 domain-containing protein n=1 Tax=Hymenobacter lutimineralis TaxID=2606448 RepID=A0A5D6VAQ8_9BACT|nr:MULTISPECIES: DUF2652 domain-containing protein [Hymenobacter]QIX61880.1 DUF2652 domain-containing protein [Hymenobacter sp. BT18]TYZ12616.1 DUF2652 domain-containing protein [Hymenobacter lutimineralis]